MKNPSGGSVGIALAALLSSKSIIPGALRVAFQKFSWNALLVFNIRAAVALLLRILTILRTRPRSILDLNTLVGEDALRFRLDAVRLGLFVGTFSGLYGLLRTIFTAWHTRYRQLTSAAKTTPDEAISAGGGDGGDGELAIQVPSLTELRTPVPVWATFAAAGIAGSSFLFLGEDGGNRSIALYTGARALECAFKLLVHFDFMSISTISDSPTGYAAATYVLFALATGQVMYAYVMRPETLPPSYWNFIVKMGFVADSTLVLMPMPAPISSTYRINPLYSVPHCCCAVPLKSLF